MKHHRVPPHSYGNGVISKGKAVGADKQSFRCREGPDSQHAHEVDKVAKIGQEVMVSALLVGVVSNRHEVQELYGVPDVKILGISSDQVATDEDVQDTAYEGCLFPSCDGLGIVPTPAESVDTLPHSLPVPLQLLVRWWNASPPFFNDSLFGMRASSLQYISLSSYFLCLRR